MVLNGLLSVRLLTMRVTIVVLILVSDTALSSSTEVTQLAMVPLSNTHSSNSVIENNRVLFMSGSLASDSFGTVSSALFDGATVYPFISTSTSTGAAGFVNGLFYSVSNFSFNARSELFFGLGLEAGF